VIQVDPEAHSAASEYQQPPDSVVLDFSLRFSPNQDAHSKPFLALASKQTTVSIGFFRVFQKNSCQVDFRLTSATASFPRLER
jgi:hypothetical protein